MSAALLITPVDPADLELINAFTECDELDYLDLESAAKLARERDQEAAESLILSIELAEAEMEELHV